MAMRIQNVRGVTEHDSLMLWWEITEPARAISIGVATDSEFTRNHRMFLLPATTTSVALDTGPGNWYYRVGAVHGAETHGTFDWSGIYGPMPIRCKKPVVALPPPRLTATWKDTTLEGVQLSTDLREPYFAFIEVSTDREFRAGPTRMKYILEPGKGVIEIDGLVGGETYHIRLRGATGALDAWPKTTVETLCEGQTFYDIQRGKVKTATIGPGVRGSVDTSTPRNTSHDHTMAEANRALLREARDKPVQRFSSYADYMQFMQAKTVNIVGR